jgi:hypothetical protein
MRSTHLDRIQQVAASIIAHSIVRPHGSCHCQAPALLPEACIEQQAEAEGKLIHGVRASGQHKACVVANAGQDLVSDLQQC